MSLPELLHDPLKFFLDLFCQGRAEALSLRFAFAEGFQCLKKNHTFLCFRLDSRCTAISVVAKRTAWTIPRARLTQ